MPTARILIVANDADAGQAYAEALSTLDVAYDIAASFPQMAEMAMERRYNGLLIDVLTLVRCSPEDKVIAYECVNLYPVLRVKWDKRQQRINVSPEGGAALEPETALQVFIDSRCRTFKAKSLRRYKRKAATLNVLVSREEAFPPEKGMKSFTVNVSAGGAFVHTMESLEDGASLWLRLVSLKDQRPIPATVRWCLPWGLSSSIPGVGVRFEALSAEQEQELKKILKL